MNIYVASSWRNEIQPDIVALLREWGHEVYDFKNPAPEDRGFSWSEIDKDWGTWSIYSYLKALHHPAAIKGFFNDLEAMRRADAFVLVMPCGASAHLEAGWAIGQGKPTCILLDEVQKPELMYKLADGLAVDIGHLKAWLNDVIRRIGAEKQFPRCHICGRFVDATGKCPKIWSDGEGGWEHE